MALPEGDASVGYSFGLEIDGVLIKQIQAVSGLKMEQDVVELKENTGEITLTRGLTADNSFSQWIQESQFGQNADARKGGAIIVYDLVGSPVKRYKLTNAWPKSLDASDVKAGDATVLNEKLVITYEQIEPED